MWSFLVFLFFSETPEMSLQRTVIDRPEVKQGFLFLERFQSGECKRIDKEVEQVVGSTQGQVDAESLRQLYDMHTCYAAETSAINSVQPEVSCQSHPYLKIL